MVKKRRIVLKALDKTLADEWQEIMEKVVPKTASQIQIDEMEKSFYAGMMAMMCLFAEITAQVEDMDVAAAKMQKLMEEGQTFFISKCMDRMGGRRLRMS